MKIRFAPALGAAVLALSLAGCAAGGGYYGHPGFVAAEGDYDGFYDDFYGPVGDGYWGPDGAFFYSDAPGHEFHRDSGGHFRHDNATGFHPMHVHHSAGGAPRAGHG
jgi:hypothetical protein